MKKLTLVAVMAAMLAIVANSYAEVQQVRLAGEIRLRGYWTSNLSDLNDNGPFNDDDTYITQRTRISVEADLEDHVLMVITLEAYAGWGNNLAGPVPAGFAANATAQHADIVHLVEAYVRFQELFWSPLSLQLGRQNLNYGHGLLISSNEKAYRFDSARLVWDMADRGLVFDLVYAKLAKGNAAGANTLRDAAFWFLNGRYEKQDSMIKDVEVYIGHLIPGVIPFSPGGFGAYVWTFGARGDINPMAGWTVWGEIAFQIGALGGGPGFNDLGGWLADVGTAYTFENMTWKPTAWIGYTLATGSETGANRSFVPWFDYGARGGIVLQPFLSNVQIISLGVDTDSTQKWTLGMHGYLYHQNEKVGGVSVNNGFYDNGGVSALTVGGANTSKSLGFEIDTLVGYNYSKDVKVGFLFGYLFAGKAFDAPGASADDAFTFRTEVTVSF